MSERRNSDPDPEPGPEPDHQDQATVDGASPQAPEVAGYTLGRRLGAGGQGQVWSATSTSGEEVAIKVLATSEPNGRREIEALRRLRHPHLVRLREVTGTATGQTALVLDLISGGSLAALVQARGRLEPGEVVTVLTPLASLLAHLHERGVVHGDVTPGNILFGQDGRPMLCDLGIVRPAGLQAREHGTEGYLDEAGDGPESDIFALGAVAWFALTGRAPATAAMRPPLAALQPGVPVALAALIDRCLLADSTRRPGAGELAVAAFDACPAEALRLLNTDPDADPVHTVTHRLRRREPSESWDDIVTPAGAAMLIPDDGGATIGEITVDADLPASPPGRSRPRIDRNQLRRAPAVPPSRRGPSRRRALSVAAVVATGLVAGGAAALYLRPADSSVAKAAATPIDATPTDAAPTDATPTDAAPTDKGSGSDGEGAADDVLKAVQELSGRRAEAFNSGDPAGLRSANADESASLATDLAALEQFESQGLRLRGVAFELTDVRVVSADVKAATVTMTATTRAHDVVDESGAVVSSVPTGAGRAVTVQLVHQSDGWRVENVA